jgi:hypothetical protein
MARQSSHNPQQPLVFDAARGDIPVDHGPTRFAKNCFRILTGR